MNWPWRWTVSSWSVSFRPGHVAASSDNSVVSEPLIRTDAVLVSSSSNGVISVRLRGSQDTTRLQFRESNPSVLVISSSPRRANAIGPEPVWREKSHLWCKKWTLFYSVCRKEHKRRLFMRVTDEDVYICRKSHWSLRWNWFKDFFYIFMLHKNTSVYCCSCCTAAIFCFSQFFFK